ncbi:MAG: hypothetical protein HYV77_01905 [Candidatus Wildermuthbacteria bacterium]|nr:hypothetical protein [Candidatus Wildermuthbacteria bacterium]
MAKFFIVFALLAASAFIFTDALAQQNMMSVQTAQDSHLMENIGPTLWGKMLHAWIALAGAVLIFSLALKFMVGGALARPIMLIGFGVLADAIVGLFLTDAEHMNLMWLGSLLSSGAIVLAIIWIAQIFGVFQFKKQASKEAPASK